MKHLQDNTQEEEVKKEVKRVRYNPKNYNDELAGRDTKAVVDMNRMYKAEIRKRVKENLANGISMTSLKKYNVKIK